MTNILVDKEFYAYKQINEILHILAEIKAPFFIFDLSSYLGDKTRENVINEMKKKYEKIFAEKKSEMSAELFDSSVSGFAKCNEYRFMLQEDGKYCIADNDEEPWIIISLVVTSEQFPDFIKSLKEAIQRQLEDEIFESIHESLQICLKKLNEINI